LVDLFKYQGKSYATAWGNEPVQRQLLLLQYKQQSNPLLLTRNYH
jgi:hypothetical protein